VARSTLRSLTRDVPVGWACDNDGYWKMRQRRVVNIASIALIP